jgi:hypothetical protein
MRRHDEDSRPPFGRGSPLPSPCDLVGFEGDSGRPGEAVVAPTPRRACPRPARVARVSGSDLESPPFPDPTATTWPPCRDAARHWRPGHMPRHWRPRLT